MLSRHGKYIVTAVQFTLLMLLPACDDRRSKPGICLSKFSSLEHREFKHEFTEPLSKLHDKLGDDYASSSEDIDLPIAEEGAIYLASTCDYLSGIEKNLDKTLVVTKISTAAYQHVVDIASEDGRVINVEERNP